MKMKLRLKLLLCLLTSTLIVWCCSCGQDTGTDRQRILRISPGKKIASLDPALAADTASQYMTAAFYDTPLQYNYTARPYRLEPSMLAAMPELSADRRTYRCRLRDDLFFQPAECFPDRESRRVTASDLVFSILRLADPRVRSTGYWLVRGRIRGIGTFREQAGLSEKNDLSVYDRGCTGLRVLDSRTFEIELEKPDPRFIYALAMPYFSAVSRRAAAFYGPDFTDRIIGSGPFVLTEWVKDYVIRMKRYDEYREEYFPGADNPVDRKRRLPLLDGMTCYLVKQPLAAWLMFLQGELDYCALDGENFDAVVNEQKQLSPALRKRRITLHAAPEFQINYIGFHFADPLLGKNLALRRAISLAFDKELRSRITNGRLQPVYGPLPPWTDGWEADLRGPYGEKNLTRARELMKEAGFPGGINPATGKPLTLTFDQAGSDTFYRQTAELLAADLAQIGIVLKPEFSNRARFFQKLASGQAQLFRLSWTGDYPDAENFFQLFYGPNAETCNRVFFRDAEFDRMYEEIKNMPSSPERTEKYRRMTRRLLDQCPWIFETQPVAYVLTHCWMRNYQPHDFGFNRWKYFSADPELRRQVRRSFTPLSMSELR